MTEKCKICGDIFSDQIELLNHFEKVHLSQLESIPCMFCEKKFANFDDILHHIHLEHLAIDSALLEKATRARDIKNQLGETVDPNAEGIGFECPGCFEQFPSIDKLIIHGKKEHDNELKPEFIEKMKKIRDASNNGKV